ncbi:hypothetical protein ABDI30_14685 [Paenibacillus cisolokensis]|uniref:hypothetical protein n=1 Tax=Paenibacillus cisolokensis TaxID=1658519 RepID=UPI003D2CD8E2
MYTNITKAIKTAIKTNDEIILTLKDQSKIAGIASWGEDKSRVKIKSADKVVWIPLNEILHVTTILGFNKHT